MASKFTITAELNLQTKNLGQVVNNLKRQFQGVDLNIKIKDMAKAESQLRNVSNEAKSASQSIGVLGSSIGTAFKRFTAVTLATGTIVGFTRAIKNAVGDAIEFEREVVKIAQATGKTTDQLKGLTNEISSVASNFGVSSKELILAARSLTQAGFAADKVTGALKLLAQTELAATFDSIGDTTEGIIALLNQFGQAAQRSGNEITFLEKSLSAINQVSKDFAVESSDLITAIRTTGSAFESAGGNLNELLALFTSVRATTRESAESIATGFRTIFTRVQRLDTINNLRALGVELQDVEGKFIGPVEATKRLSIALNSIDPKDFRFNMIVEELGGFRQVSKVIPLIQQFATTQKALNVAQGASGSLAKDAATAQQALAVQISKTREKFSTFIRDMSESSSFQGTVKTLLSMAEAFLRVADTIKPLIPLLASFAAFKIGSALLPGLRSLGSNKKAQGGRIHAFASGGLVPGQGNGDTVPAMLTPGEFVIRKSSVKKLGAENLARANKYASGGAVQYYSDGTDSDGVKAPTPAPTPVANNRKKANSREPVSSLINDPNAERRADSKPDSEETYKKGDTFTRKLVSDSALSPFVEADDQPSINLLRKKITLQQDEIKSIVNDSYGIPTAFKILGTNQKKAAYGVYGRQTKDTVSSGQSDIYRNFEKVVLARPEIKNKGWKENNSTNMSDEVDAIRENKKGNIFEIGDMKFTEEAVAPKDLLAKAAKWMAKIDQASTKRKYFKENVKKRIDKPKINFTVFEPPFKSAKTTKNNLLATAG
jgi:TP901 family phage tail tape measure protein